MSTEENRVRGVAAEAETVPPPRRLVVGVSLDHSSTLALRRAHALARSLNLDLWVVHVVSTASERARPSVRSAKYAVQQWSLFETGIALSSAAIVVRFGDCAEQLCETARRLGAQLLVVGGRVSAISAPPGELTRAIVALSAVPVLVAAPMRTGRPMLVATDLESPGVPVVRAASALARGLRRVLAIVHNVQGTAVHGTTCHLPQSIEERVLATRLETIDGVRREVEDVHDATLTRELTATDGILNVARRRDVDVIVVGVRPNVGFTCKHVLTQARRSVLAVPLPAA